MPPANRQGEAACQEAVSVCSWLCRQLTWEVYMGHSDVRGGRGGGEQLQHEHEHLRFAYCEPVCDSVNQCEPVDLLLWF